MNPTADVETETLGGRGAVNAWKGKAPTISAGGKDWIPDTGDSSNLPAGIRAVAGTSVELDGEGDRPDVRDADGNPVRVFDPENVTIVQEITPGSGPTRTLEGQPARDALAAAGEGKVTATDPQAGKMGEFTRAPENTLRENPGGTTVTSGGYGTKQVITPSGEWVEVIDPDQPAIVTARGTGAPPPTVGPPPPPTVAPSTSTTQPLDPSQVAPPISPKTQGIRGHMEPIGEGSWGQPRSSQQLPEPPPPVGSTSPGQNQPPQQDSGTVPVPPTAPPVENVAGVRYPKDPSQLMQSMLQPGPIVMDLKASGILKDGKLNAPGSPIDGASVTLGNNWARIDHIVPFKDPILGFPMTGRLQIEGRVTVENGEITVRDVILGSQTDAMLQGAVQQIYGTPEKAVNSYLEGINKDVYMRGSNVSSVKLDPAGTLEVEISDRGVPNKPKWLP